jgi:hypothetical protein
MLEFLVATESRFVFADYLLQYWKSTIPRSTAYNIFPRGLSILIIGLFVDWYDFWKMCFKVFIYSFLLLSLKVLSLCDHPALLDKDETHGIFRYSKLNAHLNLILKDPLQYG